MKSVRIPIALLFLSARECEGLDGDRPDCIFAKCSSSELLADADLTI